MHMNLLRIYSFYNFEFTYQEERERGCATFHIASKIKTKIICQFENLNTSLKEVKS